MGMGMGDLLCWWRSGRAQLRVPAALRVQSHGALGPHMHELPAQWLSNVSWWVRVTSTALSDGHGWRNCCTSRPLS